MFRRNRGLIVFMATVVVVGVGLRLIWDAATDRTPPIWAFVVAALITLPTAFLVEAWDTRRQRAKEAGR